MKRCIGIGMLVLCLVLLSRGGAVADGIVTDVNIVTGLDISNSIGLDQMELELLGMAQAIRDARVLKAIGAGEHRRIGFAVFAWHHGQFPVVVPWMVIDSSASTLIAARAFELRKLINVELESRAQVEWYIGRLTDLSGAIDHANEMLQTVPFQADRAIVNIIGNGDDNVGEDAGVARDRFVERGGTLNGLVLGDDPAMADYYRQQVIGGPGSFVMSTGDAASIVDAFVRKFIGDIVAAADRSDGKALAPILPRSRPPGG